MDRQKLHLRVLFFFYIAVLLFMCFGKFENTSDVPRLILGIPTDKLVHFCMFFPFPILAFLAYDKHTETPRATFRYAGSAWFAGLLFAFATEWGQAHLTTYRSGDPWDLLADALGITLSTVLVIIWDLSKQSK